MENVKRYVWNKAYGRKDEWEITFGPLDLYVAKSGYWYIETPGHGEEMNRIAEGTSKDIETAKKDALDKAEKMLDITLQHIKEAKKEFVVE
jgi:hypothetical protein